MIEQSVNIAIIGGGPAGLAAAISAKKNGAEQVLIIERNSWLGGILSQCIHVQIRVNLKAYLPPAET